MELDDLISAYYVTRKNKRRSADSVEFEMHLERNIVRLADDLRDHTFSPSAYTFIARRPRPREVFACEMALRVIHHYIDIRLRPLVEDELTDRTFNNRIGYGQNAAVNKLAEDIYDVTKGFTKDAWIIKMDLKGYFPNANQDIVYKQLADLVERRYTGDDKDLLHYMIMLSVFSYPTHHCYRKSEVWKWNQIPDEKSLFKKPDGIGGAIGHLIWQNAMNYYLNDFDHWITGIPFYNEEGSPAESLGLHYVRFVDDMVIVTDNKECALAYIPVIRRKLADLGCELHPKKFYCQHYTKGVEFIGSRIKMDRIYASNRIVRNAERTVHNFNACSYEKKLEAFLSSINSYLGIFKTRNGYAIARNLIDKINPAWWEFCHFDKERVCVTANEGHRHPDIISRKYNLKFKKNGNNRKNQCAGVAPALSSC